MARKKNKKKRERFVEYFKQVSPHEGRLMIGMAAKFIVPSHLWDYTGKIKPLNIKGRTYEEHEYVKEVFEGFRENNNNKMRNNDDFTDILKKMANYDHRLRKGKCRKRTRFNYFKNMRERLSKDFHEAHLQKRKKDKALEKQKTTGIKYAIRSIKCQF